MRKHSADYKLDINQFQKLNKEFYNEFLYDYYDIKLTNLLGIISSTEDFTNFLNKVDFKLVNTTASFESEFKSERLEKFAKLELGMTYYHCLETFIRIFIARCPWLELSKLTQTKYKEWLGKLSEGDFSGLNDRLSEDATILFVFTGEAIPSKYISKKDIKGIKKWIKWSATQLVKHMTTIHLNMD